MNRDLILVAVSLFVWGFGESAFFSFQPLYLEQLGADPIGIGAILGAYGLAASLAHIPAGYLADRIGRRPLMWAAWLIGMLAAWVMAMATTLPMFVTGMLLYGMTVFVIAPMNSYITAAGSKWSVGRVITIVTAGYSLGGVFGPTVGGTIGEVYGFRTIFLMAAALFVISCLMILFIRPQPVDKPISGGNVGSLLSNSRYRIFIMVYFFAIFAMYLPQPLTPNFLQNQKDLSLVEIGQLYSIYGIGIVLLNLVLGGLEHRLGFILAQACVGLFSLLIWLGSGMYGYGLAYLFLGGYRVARSLSIAQVRTLVRQANMGLAYGLSETLSSIATVLAPVLAGFLYTQNPNWIFTASLGLVATSIIVGIYYIYAPSTSAPVIYDSIEERR